MNTEESFYGLVAAYFQRPRQKLHSNTRFRKDLKGDGFDLLSLTFLTEERFHCHLRDELLHTTMTLGQFSFMVDCAVNGKDPLEERTDENL